jgi:alpha-glucosidase
MIGNDFAWSDAPDGVLRFRRGGDVDCVTNLSGQPHHVGNATVLLASAPVTDQVLPHDATAWLRTGSKI